MQVVYLLFCVYTPAIPIVHLVRPAALFSGGRTAVRNAVITTTRRGGRGPQLAVTHSVFVRQLWSAVYGGNCQDTLLRRG